MTAGASTLARWALPVATLAGAVAGGGLAGPGAGILVLAAGALAAVILLLWQSVQNLTGESAISLEEALTLGAPSAEEEQKRAVLRALKDLEYERSVGKISEEDYRELSARYRAEAKRLLRILDASVAEAGEVEAMVRRRLRQAGLDVAPAESPPPPAAPAPTDDDESARGPESADGAGDAEYATDEAEDDGENEQGDGTHDESATAPPGRACPACETRNDEDATFCKRCGVRLGDRAS